MIRVNTKASLCCQCSHLPDGSPPLVTFVSPLGHNSRTLIFSPTQLPTATDSTAIVLIRRPNSAPCPPAPFFLAGKHFHCKKVNASAKRGTTTRVDDPFPCHHEQNTPISPLMRILFLESFSSPGALALPSDNFFSIRQISIAGPQTMSRFMFPHLQDTRRPQTLFGFFKPLYTVCLALCAHGTKP